MHLTLSTNIAAMTSGGYSCESIEQPVYQSGGLHAWPIGRGQAHSFQFISYNIVSHAVES